MTPAEYDAWYRTPRGRWIGDSEYRLLTKLLEPLPGSSVLDVGCGTGYFTRRLAADGLEVTGIDTSAEMIRYAQSQTVAGEQYMVGDARRLPFPDRHFDSCVAITSLCFIHEQEQALAEMARVTCRRIVLGLLNRHSLLYQWKGRDGGSGAYRGARWHTTNDARELCRRLNVSHVSIRSAVYLPYGGILAQCIEPLIPSRLLLGGILFVAATIA
jgi:SAM-dependent methyltransferase